MAVRDAIDPEQLPADLNLINAGYVADLYDRYVVDPASVEPEWRARFDAGFAGLAPASGTRAGANGDAPQAPAPSAPPPSAPATDAPAPGGLPPGATPISGPAARLARNMTASLGVPTATTFRDMDASVLEARRRELNERVSPRRISFTHLIGYAIVRAAATQPVMTQAYGESDGKPYRLDPGAVNLGLAVDVERPDGARFLVVPVIKGADDLDFAGFVARYEELVAKARSNGLSPDDLAGGTITLTNPGTLGTTASVPRLMAGQGTIVATGAIRTVGDQRLMTISSTYDHRVIQGAESGTFLGRIEASLTGKDAFFGEVFASLGVAPGGETAARERGVSRPDETAAAGEATALAEGPAEAPAQARESSIDDLRAVAGGMSLVDAYRIFGHLAAQLDPLGSEPPGDPSLDPAFH
ncbi:MAG: 2-oxo acid dehydrogenase subunit E2, partial [Chloroflexota bacterium]|nr:2-oxo acid dehydrogenase subunit E2 [Chloroflexota bacterium]